MGVIFFIFLNKRKLVSESVNTGCRDTVTIQVANSCAVVRVSVPLPHPDPNAIIGRA